MTDSERSLAKGSDAPGPVPQGLIRLYSMRFCPYAQRARLILLAKGIKHEVVNINLKSKPDCFFEKSPLGLVPSLETSDGKIIYESPIVCEYLDDAFPGAKMLPSDPYAKAEQKMLLEAFSAALAKKNTPYFGGESVSFFDYMVWPWFEKFGFCGLEGLLDKTPKVKAWHDRMLQDPAVKATYTEQEAFAGFFKLYAKDSVEAADYGLN